MGGDVSVILVSSDPRDSCSNARGMIGIVVVGYGGIFCQFFVHSGVSSSDNDGFSLA